tara:strand:+ start:330 stop:503 length:174 start_codon:yes stop_codon:yes gene_type:complete
MSYNEIAETFSEYSKGKSSNCQHLIELFQQAMIQIEEEEKIIMVEHPKSRIKKRKRI